MPEQLKLQLPLGTVTCMAATGRPRASDAQTPASDRVEPAWRAWLEALASDAEAALGAALAYESLDGDARLAVLAVLEHDAQRLGVPRVAVFAPLLSVERDEARRERIRQAMGDDVAPESHVLARALIGETSNGDRIVLAETHVYLDFVCLTTCRVVPDTCVRWVRSEPLVHTKDAPRSGYQVDDTPLEFVPWSSAIDVIARAVVAQRRRDTVLPESLRPLLELFDAPGCEATEKVGW